MSASLTEPERPRQEFEIQFVLAFDHDVYVENDVLGLDLDIALPSVSAQLRFPGTREADTLRLRAPRGGNGDLAQYLPSEVWGISGDADPRLHITGALVVIPARAALPEQIVGGQFGGDQMQELLQEAADWWQSFCRWIWVFTAQSLNATYPDPRVLHRSSKQVISRLVRGADASLPSAGAPRLSVVHVPECQYSERLLGATTARTAAQAAGTTPPLVLELIAAARMAARRGDRRRAVIDAGTAAEWALTVLLGLPVSHRLTLGGLATKAVKQGVPIPSDTSTVLVAVRNAAIHRGVVPKAAEADRCLSIAEELTVCAEPRCLRVDTMGAFARPQRHDLLFIRPPKATLDGAGNDV